jgi:SAM-dependent methyltransferase
LGVHEDRIRWNHRYSLPSFAPDWAPDVRLAARIGDLPKGRVLDVACGVGANALFLAKRGWEVDAVDLSDVAIERLRRAANSEGVADRIHLHLADLRAWTFPERTFDLVVCTRFLDRRICDAMAAALVPGGVLFYRTFTRAHLGHEPRFRPELLLEPGELRRLFPGLLEMHYEETQDDESATALLIAQRPQDGRDRRP